ncbi:autotransporter outer membrane beta-barrel domain-containing protein [Bartonella alsatica]|uniref:Outer membrane autotransporter barrel domain-containing protein n=2 Tax=Bartonella alsatica TaxID=52764 RepID=J0YN07_9HYPH|nr:autotransporter outer membrane beta-barrel domain-containing protein [Bartonella alsatica]EJF76003.1 outer membrane autotransporter barrel domain-containing protein [Bartonella alsatica IBS 382]QLC51755.1 autotransporter outer membrane beta-barrel domain-containing protein [Bartonella alsatica]
MIKMFKNHLSLYTLTTVILFVGHDVGANMQSAKKDQFSCESNSVTYHCNDGGTHKISNKIYQLTGQNVEGAVKVLGTNTLVEAENITINGISYKNDHSGKNFKVPEKMTGVKITEGGKVILINSTLKDMTIGVDVYNGTIEVQGGSIDAVQTGVSVIGNDSLSILTNMHIKVNDPLAIGLDIRNGAEVKMKGGSIHFIGGDAVTVVERGKAILDGVSITGNNNSRRGAVLGTYFNDSYIGFQRGKVNVANISGLFLTGKNNNIHIEDSIITINSEGVNNQESYGIWFHEEKLGQRYYVSNKGKLKVPLSIRGVVDLKNTIFTIPNSTAIYSDKFDGSVKLSQNTKISGDLLLRVDKGAAISVVANSSVLEGGTRVDEKSIAKLHLSNNSEWVIFRPKYNSQLNPNMVGTSVISLVELNNSSIVFRKPKSTIPGNYQRLHIGEGEGVVYNASGNAWIYFNARLNPNDRDNNQVTDQLLIHGDVSGKTVVHVNAVSGNMEEDGHSKTPHSVSIIQVYGKAEKDSFQLNGHYVTLVNSPYKYTLRSYGPKASSQVKYFDAGLAQKGKDFWDFRLENQYVESTDSAYTSTVLGRTPPRTPSFEDIFNAERGISIRSVVPQVPTYLLLPNSVFHAGLMDISNQNKQLELLRTISIGMVDIHKEPALYLRGYGSSYRYASDLSAFEYGYGGDLDYNAVEAGILLKTIENMYGTMSFGVMGTYGRLSLQPLDVKQSQESSFNKWTATAYGSMQYDAGFYVDGLLSYGLFKGDVLTLARGKTATLEGNPLSVSLTGGQAFATGYEGFVVDPQIQVVYQHLQFDKARDIDNFDIEMGKLDQWVGRIGGRLIKTPTGFDGVNAISFYGKLYLSHSFGEKQSVRFKDAFQLGSLGSSLEAGLGFNAKLSSKFTLYGDFLYQHKLRKAGFSGTSFSGGLSYRF